MDFLYEDEDCFGRPWGSDQDIDTKGEEGYDVNSAGVEFIAIPAWRTANGALIVIKDMGTQHILNCLKKIGCSGTTWRRGYIPYFMDELKKRDYRAYTAGLRYVKIIL